MSERVRVGSQNRETRSDEYVIRNYRERDREGLLSLYQDVLSDRMAEQWFAWKYEENPYAEDVTVFVAEDDGHIVGAAGFWLLELHTGDGTMRVVQSCDGAVRRSHRRQGIYTQLFEAGLEYFADAGFEFVFDFPNELTQATFEKHGWRLVEKREAHYRLQRPTAAVGKQLNGRGGAWLDKGMELLARGYLAARARTRTSPARPDIDVEQTDEIPAAALESIYRRDVPDRFHLVRDATFYRWRFDNPHWNYTAYVGRRDGTPVSAIITGTKTVDGATVTRLADVVPLSETHTRRQAEAFGAVLEAVLETNTGADYIVAPSGATPTSVLREYGFHSNQRPPLSLVTTPTVHGVYSLSARSAEDVTDEQWRVNGRDLTDPDSWRITFSEYDTG